MKIINYYQKIVYNVIKNANNAIISLKIVPFANKVA
jgi:hypothetical protein